VAPASTLGDYAADLVQAVQSSVVKVSVSGQVPAGPAGRTQLQQGTGTGFVIDARGYIVTNYHVVSLGTSQVASHIQVELWDGRDLNATIAGTDPSTDLAVLRVDVGGLKPLRFAEPGAIKVGQLAVAIGYALDLGSTPTVTSGVISAKDRVIEEQTTSISGALQTDAVINPGNSGGPLLSMSGEVVGVNTAGLSGTAAQPVQGIFFAVSAQVAQPVVEQILASGRVERGVLGVTMQQVSAAVARTRGIAEGASVISVVSGSPAERAGIRPGDVITQIGDAPISNVGDVTNALLRYRPGSRVTMRISRGPEQLALDVTLGAPPS
jgi:serine protease Do